MAKAAAEQGHELPGPQPGWALIDTGATHTCIDEATARALSLPVVGTASISTPSDHSSESSIYPVSLEIAGFGTLDVPDAVGAKLSPKALPP